MNRICLLSLCGIFIFCLFEGAFGQTSEPNKSYVSLGGNINYHVWHDEALSPLRYAGLSYGIHTGFVSIQNNGRLYINVSFCPTGAFSATTPDKNSSLLSLAMLVNASVGYGWRISSFEDPSVRLYVGPAIHFTGNLKTHSQYSNNAMSFDVYASLAASARVEKDYSLGNTNVTLGTQITAPIVGWMARPYYSTVTTDLRNQGDISLVGIDNRIMWLGNFPMMNIRTDLNVPLTNGSLLGIGYEWEFYSTNYLNLVQAARHGAYVYLQTKL